MLYTHYAPLVNLIMLNAKHIHICTHIYMSSTYMYVPTNHSSAITNHILQIQEANFASTLPAIPVREKIARRLPTTLPSASVPGSLWQTLSCRQSVQCKTAKNTHANSCQEIAGNLLPKLCHTLPSISSRQKCWQTVCLLIAGKLSAIFCQIDQNDLLNSQSAAEAVHFMFNTDRCCSEAEGSHIKSPCY